MEADLCGLVTRTLKNHPARRILDNLAKADCNTLMVPGPPSSGESSSGKAKFGQRTAGSSVGDGRPDMNALLGGALKKRQEASEGASDNGGRPDMNALLGGALKKRQEAAGPPPGGPFGKGGPPGGLAGALGGLSGGLVGLKKTGVGAGGGGRNSAAGLLKQLKKEHDRAAAEVASLRARGVNVRTTSVFNLFCQCAVVFCSSFMTTRNALHFFLIQVCYVPYVRVMLFFLL